VLEDGRDGDVGGVGDLGDRDGVVAALQEQAHRLVGDPLSGRELLAFAATDGLHGPDNSCYAPKR
jgi:hypothetical protein